tara:strand:+ start:1876 stop:2061 length:186 start_codon:yes stop_codon:yes gene_type:complete
MSDTLQRMALALADVEAELKRRQEDLVIAEPSDESDEVFDDVDDDDDDDISQFFDDEVDNE